jgi:hypothetical protein
MAAFADASHQLAMKEAALARRNMRDGGGAAGGAPDDAAALSVTAGAVGAADGAGSDAVPTHLPPPEREPLPAGESGQDFINNIPFQARSLTRSHAVTSVPPSLLPRAPLTPCPGAPLPRCQVLSWEPRAIFFPGFADAARCASIVSIASKRLAPSSLALRAGDTAATTADIRTSQGTFLTRHDDVAGVLDWVEKRIAAVTMLPQRHGEPFNVLRYEVGQKYDSHYDTFDPESYGPQSSQRLASFLLYLNEWESGGETVFPLEGGDGLSRLRNIDYKSCALGLKVKPMRTGDALLFYSIHPNSTFDKARAPGCIYARVACG